jgi:cytochrome c oxidase subunit 2
MLGPPELAATLTQVGGLIPRGTRVDVFQQIYWAFLVLGTLVGVVVIGYMVYNAYKYRDHEGREEPEDPPQLGETPQGGGKGRKLFLSFALSAIVVISLIVWTYGTLLFVEGETVAAGTDIEDMEYTAGEEVTVFVEGYQFGWRFQYPNGVNTTDTLRVPRDTQVNLIVTSSDVHHNFWIPDQRAKPDAIPGQRTSTWFEADETGTYRAECAELCGAGHSYMGGEVVVMEQDAFDQWYTNQSEQ